MSASLPSIRWTPSSAPSAAPQSPPSPSPRPIRCIAALLSSLLTPRRFPSSTSATLGAQHRSSPSRNSHLQVLHSVLAAQRYLRRLGLQRAAPVEPNRRPLLHVLVRAPPLSGRWHLRSRAPFRKAAGAATTSSAWASGVQAASFVQLATYTANLVGAESRSFSSSLTFLR